MVFQSKRKVARFFDRCTLLLLAFCLPLLLLIEGGIDHATHALIIPLFSLLLFFHGLTVFLKSRASIKPFKLSLIPLLFVPFLIWLIFSANFISATPWKGHISLIYFFEAFIVLWIACNHLKGFRRLQTVCVGLLLMGSYSLFLGYSQFFHGRDGSLGAEYINNVSGLFHDSTAYAFLTCISLAVVIPAFFLRFMIRGKRVVLLLTGLLLLFGLIIAQDIQGYILATLVVLLSSLFAFRKREQIISFNALTLVLAGIAFGMLVLFMPSFSEHFALPYYFERLNFIDLSLFDDSLLKKPIIILLKFFFLFGFDPTESGWNFWQWIRRGIAILLLLGFFNTLFDRKIDINKIYIWMTVGFVSFFLYPTYRYLLPVFPLLYLNFYFLLINLGFGNILKKINRYF